jgi:hypothetical protein
MGLPVGAQTHQMEPTDLPVGAQTQQIEPMGLPVGAQTQQIEPTDLPVGAQIITLWKPYSSLIPPSLPGSSYL